LVKDKKKHRKMKIGLLSDTHGYWDDRYLKLFSECDEIWHAGDIGSTLVANELEAFKPLRAVYGNIDGHLERLRFPKVLSFECCGMRVMLTHIGGYPGKYSPDIVRELDAWKPDLFICGHSHIAKVLYDKSRGLLHINPGAAGNSGFHVVRTMVRFEINAGKVENLELIELGHRS